MQFYQFTCNAILIALATLIAVSLIANIRAGRPIGDRVILALITAMVTIYTFVR